MSQRVKLLPWPSESPEHNLTEMLWSYLMRGVFNRISTKHNELLKKNRLKFFDNNVKLINVTQKTITSFNFQLIDAKGCSTASYEINV